MPGPRGLVQQVDQELHRSSPSLLPRGGRLLVAVSGGADSVALLRLLERINRSDYWGWELIVGHVDHGIRGRASREDAKFVKELAAKLGLRCVIRTLRLGKDASEAGAREGRYGALAGMARGCYGVVMGHHADDQAETVLMRLFRGAGVEGLGGMEAYTHVNGLRVLRPLLMIRRNELCGYLVEVGQGFREDETNGSARYTRNRLRQRVLPVIEEFSPGAVGAIVRAAELLRQMRGWMDGEVRRLLEEVVVLRSPRRVCLDRRRLREADEVLCGMVLRDAVLHVGGSTESADFERVREAVRMVRAAVGGKEVELGGGVCLRVIGSTANVSRRGE